MIDSKRVIAIVPARSGSKGIAGKNLKKINDIPLLAYPIIASKKSKYVDKIIFSSDCDIMCEIAKSYGAEVPFIRPKELASDSAVRSDVIFHALNYVKENYVEKYDILVFLEPTSPLTSELDINRALEFFISDKCVSLVSISESPTHHPEYAIELDSSSNIIKPFMKDSFKDLAINRQSLIPVYFFDGSLYISGILEFYNYKEFYHEQTKGIELDALKSLEIDEPLDLLIAEMILKK